MAAWGAKYQLPLETYARASAFCAAMAQFFMARKPCLVRTNFNADDWNVMASLECYVCVYALSAGVRCVGRMRSTDRRFTAPLAGSRQFSTASWGRYISSGRRWVSFRSCGATGAQLRRKELKSVGELPIGSSNTHIRAWKLCLSVFVVCLYQQLRIVRREKWRVT